MQNTPDQLARAARAYEQDPRWQAAQHNYVRDDYPSSSAAFAARQVAVNEMYAIELAYERDIDANRGIMQTALSPLDGTALAAEEWGVADGRGHVAACGSEQAARQLQGTSGGELVSRRTYVTSWPPRPARGARPPARPAIPVRA